MFFAGVVDHQNHLFQNQPTFSLGLGLSLGSDDSDCRHRGLDIKKESQESISDGFINICCDVCDIIESHLCCDYLGTPGTPVVVKSVLGQSSRIPFAQPLEKSDPYDPDAKGFLSCTHWIKKNISKSTRVGRPVKEPKKYGSPYGDMFAPVPVRKKKGKLTDFWTDFRFASELHPSEQLMLVTNKLLGNLTKLSGQAKEVVMFNNGNFEITSTEIYDFLTGGNVAVSVSNIVNCFTSCHLYVNFFTGEVTFLLNETLFLFIV